MTNLEKINEDINDINNEIDRLLGEDYTHPMAKLASWLIDKMEKEGQDEIINLYDKYGNIVKKIEKNPLSVLDDIDGSEEIDFDIEDVPVDVPVKKEYDPEMAELMDRMEKAIEKSHETLARNSGEIKDSGTNDPIFKKSSRKLYDTVKINFRGVNELSVVIGGGQELKQRLSGVLSFDVITIKETSMGYIMNLKNRDFNKDVNLLLYAKTLTDKPQTNKIQLVYKNGRFVGTPSRVTFEILYMK